MVLIVIRLDTIGSTMKKAPFGRLIRLGGAKAIVQITCSGRKASFFGEVGDSNLSQVGPARPWQQD